MVTHIFLKSSTQFTELETIRISNYYPTSVSRVLILMRETSTNIPRYYAVSYFVQFGI